MQNQDDADLFSPRALENFLKLFCFIEGNVERASDLKSDTITFRAVKTVTNILVKSRPHSRNESLACAKDMPKCRLKRN